MHYPEDYINKVIQGDALTILKKIPDGSIDCIVTSPPYWALRDYGVEGQLGLEPTFQEYIENLLKIFDEVKRVLKKEGTCWVNLGDTYNGNKIGKTDAKVSDYLKDNTRLVKRKQSWVDICPPNFDDWSRNNEEYNNGFERVSSKIESKNGVKKIIIQDKCLLQIPSRFAIEMVNRGWVLRNEIIWHKPNCMPSSVKDRFTVDFEKMFFFVKNKRYYFKQQFEPYVPNSDMEYRKNLRCGRKYGVKRPYKDNQPLSYQRKPTDTSKGRNKRCVWSINTKPFKEAHFAVYPTDLIETPIKAGCPEGGIVLDPFMGSGTTAIVALNLNRKFIGIELNPEYCEIARKRIKAVEPKLF